MHLLKQEKKLASLLEEQAIKEYEIEKLKNIIGDENNKRKIMSKDQGTFGCFFRA